MKLMRVCLLICLFVTADGHHIAFSAGAKQSSDSKEAKKAEEKKYKEILQKDLDRDRKTKPAPLTRDRTVFRYTSKEQAKIEVKKGIPPGSHMTATGGAGRPLSAAEAKRRYGLKKTPEARLTVPLKKGDNVRSNRAYGGEKGRGELTAAQREKATKSIRLD
jgi:hypothetical protein